MARPRPRPMRTAPPRPRPMRRAPVGRPERRDSIPAVATILVADDSPEILRITRDYLERAGFSVVTATDGAGALRLAHQREPDLVVLDLSMPGIDGLDVARAIRRGSSLPSMLL